MTLLCIYLLLWLSLINVQAYLAPNFLKNTACQLTPSTRFLAVGKNEVTTASQAPKPFTASPWYTILEAGAVFGLLTAIDGGYSGDWSRYGLITHDQEELLKNIANYAGILHIASAGVVAFVTKQRNQPVIPAVLRVGLVGFLALGKVLLQDDEDAVQYPSVYRIKQFLADLFAGSYDRNQVNKQLADTIGSSPVVMFSFTTCPYCIKAKQILQEEYKVKVKIIELNEDKKVGYPLRAQLGRRTGRTSVPSIWINKMFIGGLNDGPQLIEPVGLQTKGGLAALKAEGKLLPLLKQAKAI
jgi:glutaredoxin 3